MTQSSMFVQAWVIGADMMITFRPKRLLEQIKGISEQKATKVLVEGKSPLLMPYQNTRTQQ